MTVKREQRFCSSADGTQLAYTVFGDHPSRPLVEVSVWWASQDLNDAVPELGRETELIGETRTFVRTEQRGVGASQRDIKEVSLDLLVADLSAVIDSIGAAEVDLYGLIDGCAAAAAYTVQHPERVAHLGLHLARTHGALAGTKEQTQSVIDLIKANWPLAQRTIADLYWSGVQPEQRLAMAANIGRTVSPEVAALYIEYAASYDVRDVLPEIAVPTRVTGPVGSGRRSPQAVAVLIPGAVVVPIAPKTGTGLPEPDVWVAQLNEFLDKDKPEDASEGQQPELPEDATQTQISSPPDAKTFASGRYVVVRLLGEGAQKSVYLVDDTVLGRQCALSTLNAALLDPGDVDRIKREAQTMAQFGTQQNIVTVYDYGEEDGAPFIVCEYVSGGELRDELAAADGPLPLERALALATDICRALSFAHSRDIVHRDLKPENVWLTEERSAKLGDFGIALSLGRTRLTMPGGITGTATYMAPEQASGDDVDARTDLYALGVLLYELVTGSPPFTGDDPNAIMYQHVNTEPESPVTHNEAVPPGLERLIMKLLAKPKNERPASAEEVLAELEHAGQELAGGQPGAPTAVRTTEERPIEQEIRFCTSADGTRIAYATYGNDAAPPLVFVRSETAQESSWNYPGQRALYQGLASGRRLVTLDRRGVGSSQRDVDDLAIPAQVADLAAVVDELGLENFDLLGGGTGGAQAAAYAVEHPERVGRLVLLQPNVRTSGSPLPGFQEIIESMRANWPLARRSLAAILFPNGPTDLQRWYSDMLRDSIAPEVAARYYEVSAEFDGRAILRSVQAPTLVLAHSDSPSSEIASVRAVASLIPDARLVTLDGDRAALFVDPSQVLAAIQSFLDEADAESEAEN